MLYRFNAEDGLIAKRPSGGPAPTVRCPSRGIPNDGEMTIPQYIGLTMARATCVNVGGW